MTAFTLYKRPEPVWFTMPGHSEKPCEYLLAPLSSLGAIDARNGLSLNPGGVLVVSGKAALAVVQECVRDWSNVFGEDGAELKFDRRLLQELPAEGLAAIASKCITDQFEWERRHYPSVRTEDL